MDISEHSKIVNETFKGKAVQSITYDIGKVNIVFEDGSGIDISYTDCFGIELLPYNTEG